MIIAKIFNKNNIAILSLLFITVLKTSFSLPQDPLVEFGEANFDYSALQKLKIITNDKAIINWQKFSIDIDEITKFIQPNENSIVLNRVIGETKSDILGNLKANGQFFIINQNGFLFGKDAIIDTGSFTASTLDVVNQTFLENKDLHFKGSSEEKIINLGIIKAKDGDVTLLGYLIDNQGILEAPNGEVILACGNEILLSPSSDQKIFIKPQIREEESFKEVGIKNSGSIEAIQTKMIAEGNPYQYAIKHTGEIDALGISSKDGKVYLRAEDGVNIIDGTITCKNEDETGGYVRLLGECVQLLDNANIDVSANKDGGSVLIGGAYQGANPDIINAKAVYVGKEAQINASSLIDGAGGQVILWSDELTQFYGNILAQGGKIKGDGGFVEISSLGFLDPSGQVSTKAYFGEKGTLLLDPPTVVISTAATAQATPPPPAVGGGGPYAYSFSGANPVINNTVLVSYLNDGDVTINTATGGQGATGTIQVGDGIIATPINWNAPTTLTMIAGTSIVILDSIQNADTTSLDSKIVISLQAPTIDLGNSGVHTNAVEVDAFSGSVQIQAPTMLGIYGGNAVGVTTAEIVAGSGGGGGFPGSINITCGDLTIQGGVAPSVICPASIQTKGSSGSITINMTGDLNVTGGNGTLADALITAISGDVNLTMTGDNKSMTFQGGTTTARTFIATSASGNININMTGANGNCNLLGGTSAGAAYATFLTQSGGNITTNITGDYIFSAGAASQGIAGIWAGSASGVGNISMTGRNFTLNGGTAGADNDVVIRTRSGTIDINATGTVALQGGNFNNITNALIQTDGAAGNNDVTINTNSLTLRGSPNAVTNSVATVSSVIGNIAVNATGDVTLRGSDAGTGNTARIFTTTSGNVTVTANNLNVTSGLGVGGLADIFTPSGDINLDVQNLNLLGTAANVAKLETQGSDILIRSATDFAMGAFSSIVNSGVGDLTIVVDDDFPTSPGIGTGSFIMDATATLSTTSGAIRVFSARQPLNTISGILNGASFTPGAQFTDTAREQWGTYYPDTFGGVPFTIFYKDSQELLETIEQPIFVAMAEAFRDWHPYDEYIKWALGFNSDYVFQRNHVTASYENLIKHDFFIRRRNREEANVYLKEDKKKTSI